MLKRVVVLKERLLSVERRVEVSQLDLAHVLLSKLRKRDHACESVERVTPNQEVVARATLLRTDLSHSARAVEQSYLRDSVIRRSHPDVAPVLVRQEPLVLVGPRQ